MDGFKQECKLCGNIISDENLKVIGEVVKNIFDSISLKLILNNETQNVMCTICSSKLIAALNFKSTCLSTENIIIPYIDFEDRKPVDLKEIYAKEKGSKQGSRMLEDWEICRLCLQPTGNNHKSIQEVPVDSIEIYIPEINFAVSTNPVICLKCHDALCAHSIFIRNCLDVDKKINGDAMDGSDKSLKTEEIEIKSEETDENIVFEALCDINKEEREEGDTPLQSQIDSTHTEESKSLYDLDDGQQTTIANYQSEQCSFKITSGTQRNCWDVEEKSNMNSSNGEDMLLANPCIKMEEIKVEIGGSEEWDTSLHSQSCVMDTKETKILYDFEDLKDTNTESTIFSYKNKECTSKTPFESNRKIKQDSHKNQVKLTRTDLKVQMYQCDKCIFKTRHTKNYTRHQLLHKNPIEVRMYQCDECDYKTIRKDNLEKHQLRHKDPSEVQMFECDECDYKTIQKKHLKQHQLRHKVPLEARVFRCDQCDYKSIHKGSLRIHQLVHKDPSEVRKYKCDECDYKSIQKGNLLSHQLRHKDPSEVQMFKCDQCDHKSARKRELRQHQLKHKHPSEVRVFKCDECDYESIYKSYMNKHQLRHKRSSEGQIFKCDYCDYKSIRKGNLRNHQLIHKDAMNGTIK